MLQKSSQHNKGDLDISCSEKEQFGQLKNSSRFENLTRPGRHMPHSKDTWEGEAQGRRLKNTTASR